MSATSPQRAPNGNFLLPSVQKKADGSPRFLLSPPPGYAADPGLEILARLETERAGFEYPTRAFFDAHLEPGDIFLDVGAHLGLYSLGAATRHPGKVKVVAFEPHPLNQLNFIRQLALNGLQHAVELVGAAAGAAPGLAKLWPYSTMGNFIAEHAPPDAPEDNPPLTVPVVPLDMLFDGRPDLEQGRVFAKIDVEGYEPAVVAGAARLLASGRAAALVLEKSDFYADPARRVAFEMMIGSIRAHGYSIWWFPHAHLPCALIPWVDGNETGNLIALAPGFVRQDVYDGPYVPYTALPPPMKTDFTPADQAALTERLIEARGTDGWRWANPRNLDVGSEARAALALPHIPARCRLLDLGAGLMAIVTRMGAGIRYTPVDLVRYARATVLLDLNEGRFPDGAWDCAFALELLEHIHDVPPLLTRIRASCKRLVCTYKGVEDVPDSFGRRALGYVNDFDRAALQAMLEAAGWQVTATEVRDGHSLFVCD